jgi:hypoxanthine phosphoribosyltransferase
MLIEKKLDDSMRALIGDALNGNLKPAKAEVNLPALRPVEVLELNKLADADTLRKIFVEFYDAITTIELGLSQYSAILCTEDFEDSGKSLNLAKKLVGEVDNSRKSITGPILDAKATIDSFCKRLVEGLNQNIDAVTKSRNNFAKKVEAERKAEQERIRKETEAQLQAMEKWKAKEGLEDAWEAEKLNVQLLAQVKEQELQAENPALKNVRKSYTAQITGNPVQAYIKLLAFYMGKGKGDWSKLDFLLKHAEKNGCPPIDGVIYEENLKAIAK